MLTVARLNQISQGLRANARKVYDAIPQGEEWRERQVLAELQRIGLDSLARSAHVVRGCLDSLVEAGLVRERGGLWSREPIKVIEKIKYTESSPMTNNVTPIQTKPKAPLERLADVAQHLRTQAQ